MRKTVKELEQDVQRLTDENSMLQTKIDVLEQMLAKAMRLGGASSEAAVGVVAMRKMSPKQHAALQMVLRGATNADIAERFGVTESTAKVYVRSIMGHVGARTRAQIVAKMLNAFNDMGESDYQIIAGIPKDWDANWHKYPEVNKTLFEKTRG